VIGFAQTLRRYKIPAVPSRVMEKGHPMPIA
jgi:hypothetical protein